jgi:hypothetical protein
MGHMILDDGISVERKYKQQGNMTEARDVLRSILAIDNRHEDTWLLFSKVAESNKNAVYCLSQVLKINLSKQKQQPDQPPYLPSRPATVDIPWVNTNVQFRFDNDEMSYEQLHVSLR